MTELCLSRDWCKLATGTSTGQPPWVEAAATVPILLPAAVARFSSSPQAERRLSFTAFARNRTALTAQRLTARWCTTDGNFYGTTSRGGASGNCPGPYVSGCGTVFKITPSGILTTLHSFNYTDGSEPWAGLVQASDGNFYGTTEWGGAYGAGTVFEVATAGTLTTLHTFDGTDGYSPLGALVEATDGNFYGTTMEGGANGSGTVFRITPSGTLTTLYSFCSQTNCSDGYWPYAGLVQASDGNFYGTTGSGGAFGHYGTVFKITPSGAMTTLYSFCAQIGCPDGEYPGAELVQAADGNLYGTTQSGGTNQNCDPYGCGTVFKISPSGTLTTLHSFNNADGSYPYAGLVQARDGNFYGTTLTGGADGDGTVFRLLPVRQCATCRP